jgi:hypothetical protein
MKHELTGNANWWFDHPTMATNGISYRRIFDSAIELLFGSNSIISDGRVFRAAESHIDFEADSPQSALGFNRHQAEQFLYDRNYSVDVIQVDAECDKNLNAYAWAMLGVLHVPLANIRIGKVWMNPFTMNRDARAFNLPDNATGVDMMTWWTAAVFLHELAHVLGFVHGQRIDNTATHPYNRTLPQVAYRSVITVSGYSAGFFLENNLNNQMKCGTTSGILPYKDIIGDLHKESEMSEQSSKFQTAAARDAVLLSSLTTKEQR